MEIVNFVLILYIIFWLYIQNSSNMTNQQYIIEDLKQIKKKLDDS